MSNLITNYNVNVNGVKKDLGTIIQNTSSQTINIPTSGPTSGYTNSVFSLCFNPNNQQVIYDNSIYPSMSRSSVNGNTSISFGANKRYGENGIWVAVGTGTNSIAFSYDSINWSGLGTSIFTTGYGIAYNGTLWVAVGKGTHSIAYSYDGINWDGLGNIIFTDGNGFGIIWDNNKWVAVGNSNTTPSGGANALAIIANSQDGINWIIVNSNPFNGTGAACNGIAWNGKMYIIVGKTSSSSNPTIAYSYDGSNNWTGVTGSGSILFPASSIIWTGSLWVAGGSISTEKTICSSSDGINWTIVSPLNIINTHVYSLGWNGKLCLAGGGGTNSMAYSPDGSNNWIGLGTTSFNNYCYGIMWNGIKWIAVGSSTNTIAYSSDGINWTGLGNSVFTTGRGVAWGGKLPNTITFPKKLIVVSGASGISYSYDGSNNWVRGSSMAATCVAYNGEIWVAGMSLGMQYSYDGMNWKSLLYNSDNLMNVNAMRCFAWNGNIWLAGGQASGTTTPLWSSSDGITWTNIPAANINSYISIEGISWNGKLWVAVGYNTGVGDGCVIAYSYNAITWNLVNNVSNFGGCYSILWNGILFVATCDGGYSTIYSYDGINWNVGAGQYLLFYKTTAAVQGRCIAWNGNMWVIGGGILTGSTGSIKACFGYSSDGITWTSGPAYTATFFTFSGGGAQCGCSGLVWDGSKFIATGVYNTTNTFASSNDGINWVLQTSSVSLLGGGVAYNQNIPSIKIQHPTIAVGEGTNTIAYSPDGIRWTGLGKTIFSTKANGVAWNGTRWVAVGSGTNSIAYSSDGINWTGITGSTTNIFSEGRGVAWNGTRFVAVGTGTNTIAYSSDGINWSKVADSNNIFTTGNGIAWNGTRWVAVGSGANSIVYSSDGITWNQVIGSTSILPVAYGVSWNGTRWFAVGLGYIVGAGTAEIAYSDDGISGWVKVTGNNNESANILSVGYGVAWNGFQLVAVGSAASNSIAYSSDGGINWVGATGSYSILTTGNGIAWNGTRWVAVGSGANSIVYSSDGKIWFPVTNSNNIFSTCYGIAGNPKVGATIVPSAIHLNNNLNSNTLTFSSESYYQNGVNNITIGVTSKPV